MGVHRLLLVTICVALFARHSLSAFVITADVTDKDKKEAEPKVEDNAQEVNSQEDIAEAKEDAKSVKSSESSSSEESESSKSSSEEHDKTNKNDEIRSKKLHKRSIDTNENVLDNANENLKETNDEGLDGIERTSSATTEEQPSAATTLNTDSTGETNAEPIVTNEEDSTTETQTTTESNDNQGSLPSSTEKGSGEEQKQSFTEFALEKADKLSNQIRKVLVNYREQGVVIIPGQYFPEPMSMEDFSRSFSVGRITFKNVSVHGLSNFTLEQVNTDLDRMQVYVLLHMKRVVVLGNYTLTTWLSHKTGSFNATLIDVESEGVAEVESTEDGHLEATDSQMDMAVSNMALNFTNIGGGSSLWNTLGEAVFNSIKPQILDRVNLVIRNDVNQKLKDLSIKFINKVSPVEAAFTEGRRYVREHGYDPLKIDNEKFVVGGLVHLEITEFNMRGLSTFKKVGNISLSMDAGVIQFGIHVATGSLVGDFGWSAKAFAITKFGRTNFTVNHLQVRALVNQSIDVRQKPQLDDLDLELGWVKVKMEGNSPLNTLAETAINSFPKLLRHMIIDTLENPLHVKIQDILNKVNVESFVEDNLPRLDNFGL